MNLGFFFTRTVSLQQWVLQGLLSREQRIYQKMLEEGLFETIYWFTYGVDDQNYSHLLYPGIVVIPMPRIFNSRFGKYLYSLLFPFWHRKIFKKIDLIKTNQMQGSWSALLAKWIYGIPLYLRTGYTWSQLLGVSRKGSLSHKFSLFVEKIAYRWADFASVSSVHNLLYLQEQHKVDDKKVFILGNFVDTKIFCSRRDVGTRKKELLFVGRLNKEKNIEALIRAVSRLGIPLAIYGDGEEKESLLWLVKKLNAPVTFYGKVNNEDLVEVYNTYCYYILCSYAEGLPKTLIEAMACGCVCLGTNVLGINEIIEDQKNGFLIEGVEEEDLIIGIQKGMGYENISQLSLNAMDFVARKFSLDTVFHRERQKILEHIR